MVRIINIDTKTHTIRVSNGKDDLDWFTTDTGSHVPLKKGQSKAEAIKEHFGDKKTKQQPAKKDEDIMSWPFHKAMELPGDDPRLVQYLKAHHAKWKAAKENDKIETIKDKIIDGLTEGVYSQDYTQLVAKELDDEIAETEKQPAKQDKKSNPQLERLEKMGKAWGKDQMSVLRELGKRNPQGLKDELDRIDAERERTTKAHKEWLKGKADKQQPAKKSAEDAKESLRSTLSAEFRIASRGGYQENIDEDGNLTLSIRDLGDWEVSPEDRYDPDNEGEDFEDWDWERPTDETRKKVNSIAKNIEQTHGVKVYVDFGEKNWTTFTIIK